jgi:hypothetical protein
VSGFLAVGSGILTILNGLAPILGPLIGQITTFGVVLKGLMQSPSAALVRPGPY